MDQNHRQEQISKYLADRKKKKSPDLTIQPQPTHSIFPLSFGQERLWFLYQLDQTNPTYNRPTILHFQGKLNPLILTRCIDEIVERHHVLRTTYHLSGRGVVAELYPPAEVPLQVVDLSGITTDERSRTLQQRMDEVIYKPFNLETGPIFRTQLYKLDQEDFFYLFVTHHIIFDAWSEYILINEISSLYKAHIHSLEESLPAPSIQYADYVHWQREQFRTGVYNRQLAYWKDRLDNTTTLKLPLDHQRPSIRTYAGRSIEFEIPISLIQSLKRINQQEGTTLFMTFLAGYLILLHRYTADRDMIIGTAVAGRRNHQTQNTMGLFINTLALRFELEGNPTFRELLKKVRKTTLEAFSNAELPFYKIMEEIRTERSLAGDPYIQVFFNLENIPEPARKMDDIQIQRLTPETSFVQFDLSMDLQDSGGAISGSLEYNQSLFNHRSIERMVSHYLSLLEAIVSSPDQKIGYISYLAQEERKQILQDWNDTAASYSRDLCLHHLFENQAKKTPHEIAIVFQGATYTYSELNHRSNQMAHFLLEYGIGRGNRVGILIPKSYELISCLIGVMKTGATYVPLDPTSPSRYLSRQVQDAQVQILLHGFSGKIPFDCGDCSVIQTQEIRKDLSGMDGSNPNLKTDPNDLVYIVYTSGTTGNPKGVPIHHSSVINYLEYFTRYCELGPGDKVMQVPAISFDASVEDIFGTLTSGASLVLFPDTSPIDMKAIYSLFQDKGITCVLSTVPSFWRAFTAYAENHPLKDNSVRLITISGEVLYGSDCQNLWQIFGDSLTLVNTFGPTESTIVATYYQVPHEIYLNTPVLVGKPIQNYQVYVLDEYLSAVPIGIPGEMYIAGVGLSPGYLNQPGVTAQSFIPNPFSKRHGARLYRTGDRVRYLPDGNIEFIGRVDRQVKVRGRRIEIGEVEATIRSNPAIGDCAVVFQLNDKRETLLIAYITPSVHGKLPEIETMRDSLQDRMPSYMIPSIFVSLEALPLTTSGKINYQELPIPDLIGIDQGRKYIPPRTEIERTLSRIWADHLGVEKMGINDDFFVLGGHSLTAIRIMADIERALGIELPLATLFQASTIENLVEKIQEGQIKPLRNTLVPVQPLGSKPILFCLPPAAATAMRYERLSKKLGIEQPLYGFDYPGMDGKSEPLYSIPELASTFLHDLQQVQPFGPYYLCGMCYGGNVAFEMANQLTAQGQKVAFLGIIDSNFAPRKTRSPRYVLCQARLFLKERILNQEINPGDRIRMNPRWDALWKDPSKTTLLKVFEANVIARLAHKTKPYSGKITKFSTDWYIAEKATKEWRKMTTAELEDHIIPGSHHPTSPEETGILGKENIATFVEVFRSALERAQNY